MATTDIRNGDIGPHYTGEWVSDCQQLHVQYQTNTVHLAHMAKQWHTTHQASQQNNPV